MSRLRILTLNNGSSSLKFSVYEMGEGGEDLKLSGKLDRLGSADGSFKASDGAHETLVDERLSLSDHGHAVQTLLDRLPSLIGEPIDVVAHRIVQGGPRHLGPERVTPDLLDELKKLVPLDPPHLPAALEAVEQVGVLWSDVAQVACFDTSFHRTLPCVAQILPLPRQLTEGTALMRYGFHGLSYEFIAAELTRIAGPQAANGKVVIAHLGNGASMAALRDGKSLETTMGFTPASGLVMGSRSGDIDPGVLDYLLREGKLAPNGMANFIYQQSGLKGVSGLSSDLRDLMKAADSNPHAQEALDLFCYQARKALGALVAVLDGLETLVFTGGIGENLAMVRSAIGEGMQHLGLRVDPHLNEQHQDIISTPDSRVTVRVMKTNEELTIARHAARLQSLPP